MVILYYLFMVIYNISRGLGILLHEVSTAWQWWEVLVNRDPVLFIRIALILCIIKICLKIWRKRSVYVLPGKGPESEETKT